MYEDILERVTNVRTWLISKFPFYGVLAMRMHPVIDESLNTMGVDGKRLLIGPEFVRSLPTRMVPGADGRVFTEDKQLMFVLMHEVLHLALGHLWRRGNRNFKVWNYACDYAVNMILHLMLVDDGLVGREVRKYIKEPKGLLLNSAYMDMTAEQIYDQLMKEMPPVVGIIIYGAGSPMDGQDSTSDSSQDGQGRSASQKESGNGPGSKQSGQPNAGMAGDDVADKLAKVFEQYNEGLLDDHGRWQGKDDADFEYSDWMSAVATTIQRVDGMGLDPGCYSLWGAPNAVIKLIEEFFNPTKSWRQILSEFAEPTELDWSFQPPDPRFYDYDFFLPDEHYMDEKVTGVYFWCDNSRSVGEPYRILFASELVGAFTQFGDGTQIWYGLFDAHCTDPQELFVSKGVESMLGCGTKPQVCFEKMKELNLMETAKVIVILTDGKFGPVPKEIAMGVPVIWALVPNYIEYGRRQLEEAGWDRIIVLDPEVQD